MRIYEFKNPIRTNKPKKEKVKKKKSKQKSPNKTPINKHGSRSINNTTEANYPQLKTGANQFLGNIETSSPESENNLKMADTVKLILITILIALSTFDHIYKYNRLIGLVGRVYANGPGDLGSIPGRVIPKTLKMVLDNSLLNTQKYKVRIEGKVEQSRERSSALPYTSV